MSEILQRLTLTIETRIATIEETSGNEALAWAQRHAGYRAIIDDLVNQESAKYRVANDAHELRLAGIRTCCTAGAQGLLLAWLRKAKAEIDGRRAA